MELSIFLAKVCGLFIVIVSAMELFRKELLQDFLYDYFNNTALVIVTGVFTLVCGLLLVVSHNVWVWDWSVLITLFGYVTLFWGLVGLFIPNLGLNLMRMFVDSKIYFYIGVLGLALGLYLSFVGYWLH